jgi:hypothetical protein
MSKFGNYVVQTAFEKSNTDQKNLILKNIKQTLINLQFNIENTPLKHVVSFLQKFDVVFEEL